MKTAVVPPAKKLGRNADISFRKPTRTSKWDALIEEVLELEDEEMLSLDVPDGRDPEKFRNTVSNAIYNNIRRPKLFPEYRFPVRLTDDLDQVIIRCVFDGKPKPRRKKK